jgi:5'(3')-deoxyribonucleotidase
LNKEPLFIDHDDTMSDFMPALLNFYNKEAHDNLTPNDITDWNLSSFVKQGFEKRIYEYLKDPAISRVIFMSAPPLPHMIEVTQWLQQYFDLWVASATHPFNVRIKAEWLIRYTPHISIEDRYIVTPDKTFYNTKVQRIIDDKFSTSIAFKQGLLMNKSWNAKYTDFPQERRVNNWIEIQAYFENLISKGQLKGVA